MAWSNLPSDVLGNIAKRIEHITHFQQFSLVCRSWYVCSVENRGHLPRRPPFVVLPYDEDTKTCNLLSINKGPMQLHLPELSGKWCCGASKGWLVLIDNQYNISLLNPFTRVELQLPQHPAFPDMMPDYAWHGPWKHKFIAKAVLSSTPDSPDCVVILIVSSYCILSFCKLVEGKWKSIQAYSNGGEITWLGGNSNAEGWIPGMDYIHYFWSTIRSQLVDEQGWLRGFLYVNFQDIIWFRGKVYAAHGDKHATICEVNDLALEEMRWPDLEEYHVNEWDTTFRYLVESRGELLLVIRYVRKHPRRDARNLPKVRANRPHGHLHKTLTFSIFSLEKNSDGSTRQRTRLDSIGDRCLFLSGVSKSTCCSVLDFPQLRANSIYFADNFWDACFRNMYGCLDVGVFSLETGTVESLFEDQPFFATPVYFI